MPGLFRHPPRGSYEERARLAAAPGLSPYTSTYVAEVLADTPIVYWRMGEAAGPTAADSSGNSRHGTLNSTVAPGSAGALTGDLNTAFKFTPSGFVSRADEAALDLGDGPFTLEFWAKRDAAGTSGYILQKGATAFGVFFSSADDKLHFEVCNTQGTAQESGTTSTAMHHWVIVQGSGATDAIIYKDGTAGTTVLNTSTFASTADPLELGRSFAGASTAFAGVIDEVALYGTALSASRVLAHYNAGTASGGPINRTLTDALALADSLVRQGTFLRALTDSVTYGNTVARVVSLARSATDALGIGNTVVRVGTFLRTAADSLTAGNTVSRVFTGARTLADSLSMGDTVTRVGTFLRTAADSLNIADIVTGIRVIARTVADSLNIADAVTRTGTFLRTTADALGIGNTVVRVGTFLRTAADSLSFSDVVEAIKSGVIVRTVTDALNIGDTVSRTGTFLRTAADSLNIAQTVDGLRLIVRTVADSLSIGNTVTRTVTLARTAADSLGLADAANRMLSLARALADALSTATSVVAEKGGIVIGGIGPRISAAIASIPGLRAMANRPGGSATSSKPDGSADHSKPEH